jgi:hypothetical protein
VNGNRSASWLVRFSSGTVMSRPEERFFVSALDAPQIMESLLRRPQPLHQPPPPPSLDGGRVNPRVFRFCVEGRAVCLEPGYTRISPGHENRCRFWRTRRKRSVEDEVFKHSCTEIMDLAKPLWTSAASRFFPSLRREVVLKTRRSQMNLPAFAPALPRISGRELT